VSPAGALPPKGLLLLGLRIRHPAPAQVAALLARIGLSTESLLALTEGNSFSLVADIQTPFGPRMLGET
jgi:hypothetical protein